MRAAQRILTDEEVLNIRARFDVANGERRPSQTDIAREFGITQQKVSLLVRGKIFAHLPGAIDRSVRTYNRLFTPEVVLFMRLAYARGVNTEIIGAAFNVKSVLIGRIVTGELYPEVPEALPLRPAGIKRKLTDDQVARCRRIFRSRQVSIKTLAVEHGVDNQTMLNAVRGYTYKHLPNAVPTHIRMTRRGLKIGPNRKKPQATLEAIAA